MLRWLPPAEGSKVIVDGLLQGTRHFYAAMSVNTSCVTPSGMTTAFLPCALAAN
jgi:hypothetical protein